MLMFYVDIARRVYMYKYIFFYLCTHLDIRVHVYVCMKSDNSKHTSCIIMQESDDQGIQERYFASFFRKQADA